MHAAGRASADVRLILIPKAVAASPFRALQRHCGCDLTTLASDEQQEEDGVDVLLPVT